MAQLDTLKADIAKDETLVKELIALADEKLGYRDNDNKKNFVIDVFTALHNIDDTVKVELKNIENAVDIRSTIAQYVQDVFEKEKLGQTEAERQAELAESEEQFKALHSTDEAYVAAREATPAE